MNAITGGEKPSNKVRGALAEGNAPGNPRVGMLAIVRKRRAVISEVRPFTGGHGVSHLVRLDYKDEHRPESEEVIWELEPKCLLLEPNELPRPSDPPMPPEDFDALMRAAHRGAILAYLDPVRFTRADELKPAEKDRVKQVVVRRLKGEIV